MANKKNRKKILSYTVIYQAVPEGGYIAFVPSLPGCHTQGESLEEAERNIKEAVQVYLESLNAPISLFTNLKKFLKFF